MTNKFLFALTLLSAIGCGLIGGVFFAFSTFVMKALAALPPPQGIAAMKSINIAVINPIFLGPFLGTAVGCVILLVSTLLTWQKPGATCVLVGSALYLLGTFLESARFWAEYVAGWTLWNHVRTIAAIAAASLLMIALWFSSAHRAI